MSKLIEININTEKMNAKGFRQLLVDMAHSELMMRMGGLFIVFVAIVCFIYVASWIGFWSLLTLPFYLSLAMQGIVKAFHDDDITLYMKDTTCLRQIYKNLWEVRG